MDLRQLQLFAAVAEEGSFTRAAARLHLAQPGVSARIRQLERELGHVLLDRSGAGRSGTGRSGGSPRAGRPVTPTRVGEAVLPYARAALEAVENVRHAADAFTGLLRGHVSVGLVSGATDARGRFDIASVLADFHDEHPHVEIALTEDTSDRMLRALRHGALDIAVAGLPDGHPPPGTDADIVVDEPVVVAVAPDDPLLSETRPLRWTALRDRALISLPRGTGLRGVLEQVCAQAGFQPRVAFEAAAPPLLAQLAARGLGVAVVPGMPPEAAFPLGLRTLRPAPEARARIGLTWRTGGPASPAARALLAPLRAALTTPRSDGGPDALEEWRR
ncbi:LysR family transcriptional regulator [Streptomyces reniochalinae]|uniref:LysR family transcriptional regulator n=1 Tax=Streptomyces reniochalinae TaxID=2250578 RepID=A0A367EZ80_9ACTN|nr:LysR family transcriptional regulator [Streptomyces reniochalinae]RCG23321.1 LysR family transcriptional regulator [Streptomyces reniochalinae]